MLPDNLHMYKSILKFCLIALIITGASPASHAQYLGKVDSLKKRLSQSIPLDEKYTILNELFKQFNQVDYQKALEYAYEFDRLAKKNGDSLKIIEGGRKIAYSLMDLGRNEEAKNILIQILGISERNKQNPEVKKQIKFILNNAGIANSDLGNYDIALEYHFKSLLIREEEGDKKPIGTALNNLGNVFYNLKDYKQAIEYFQRAIEIKKEVGDDTDLDRVFINLGLCFNQINDYKNAIRQFNKSFELCSENCTDNVKREGLLGLGVAYLGDKEFNKAEDYFLKSLEISKKQNNALYQVNNLYQLGLLEALRGNTKKELLFLDQARVLAEGSDFVEPLIRIYDEFSQLYRKELNYEREAFFHRQYRKLQDSTYSGILIKNLTKVQTNFAERANLKTISRQNDLIILKEKLLDKQRTITALAIVIAMMLLGFTYFAIQSGRTYSAKLKKHNEELEQKVLERTKELQKSNEKLLKAQHDLNHFLYKTSHDIRGPVATLKGLYNLINTNKNSPAELNDIIKWEGVQIQKITKILDRITLIGSIQSVFLRPEVIDFHGLINNIIDFERRNGQLKHIRVLVDVEPGLKMISDSYLVHLILENMVDNSLKFFNESPRIDPFVKVTVSTSGSDALIKVEDNGVGIVIKPGQDVFTMFLRGSERSETGGVGLYLCKVIADKLDGTIKLEKTSEHGTTFSLKLTLDATEQINAWNTYLQTQYLEDVQRYAEHEKREQDGENSLSPDRRPPLM